MTVRTFYRLSVWLPVGVPGLLALVVWTVGFTPFPAAVRPLVGGLIGSLVYGGIPYTALALWATWRIGRVTEREIQRLMVRSPLLMVAALTLFWFVAGARVGRPEFGWFGPFAAVFVVFTAYGYMGLVLLVREQLGNRLR